MVGQSLGHYKILEKLGAGGMGEVYRAEDTALEREVALKVLPPGLAASRERLDRFQREARTLAALDHPNIVTIHSVEEVDGVHFLTMQLVEGRTLSELIPRGGMSLERIFDVAIPLADALAAAHEKGVIHRDLKPANIMLSAEGRVKVLDFGLAKLRLEAAGEGATALPTEPMTEPGRAVGTAPYMSPEQLEGRSLDARTDIFSLGVLLYEMATGERPFRGDSSASLISAILRDTPREVEALRSDLPRHLGRIVRHCLDKDPERRFQSAKDVRNELEDLCREATSRAPMAATPVPEPRAPEKRLRWLPVAGAAVVLFALVALWLGRRTLTPPPAAFPDKSAVAVETEPPRIVVLPFENLGAPEDEYFADGMTEEITSRLAAVRELGVISRTSAMQYKDDRPSLGQIGEELGVQYVLEGTVRWARGPDGQRVRITPQLIRVEDDRHLWASSYDRMMEDIFAIQSDIARRVVQQLGLTLLEAESRTLEAVPTDHLEAYQAFLRATELDRTLFLTREEVRVIDRLLERAVSLDPDFVLAWASLASFNCQQYWRTASPERSARARSALDRALALDPLHPATLIAQSGFYVDCLEDFERSLDSMLRVAELRPNDAEVQFFLATIYRNLGRWEESLAAFRRAVELDPRNSRAWNTFGATYDALGRSAEAQRCYDRALAVAPDLVDSYRVKAWSLLVSNGDMGGALGLLELSPLTEHFYVVSTRAWRHYYERSFQKAAEVLQDHPFDDPLFEGRRLLALGCALRHLGRIEEARQAFESVVALHETEAGSPGGPQRWTGSLNELALAYALLGRREDALRLAERALTEVEKSTYHGPPHLALAAWVSVFTGDEERALSFLEEVLSRPGSVHEPYAWGITPAVLRYHPDLDTLRSHPRFQALLERYEQQGAGASGAGSLPEIRSDETGPAP